MENDELERVAIPPATAAKLLEYRLEQERVSREAAIYLSAVCETLGVDVTRVTAIDSDDPALMLKPEAPAE